MVENIFVAGLDSLHLGQLQSLKNAERYRFHSLISYEKIKCGETFPVRSFVHRACQTLERFAGSVDRVIGFWDFPVSTVLPYIRQQAGLGGPSLISVLKCEHKYWSRLIQAEVVPELIPEFRVVHPFDGNAVERCDLPFPFWLKPVKSVLSHLGFLVRDRIEFTSCLETIREHIGRYALPFNYILGLADLPEEIRVVDGFHCIAESLISTGRQCTLEGYVLGGEVVIYGVIDSIREETESCSSFARYQYPSTLPVAVPLNYAAQAIPAGYRLRVAVSTSYWPMAWPAPEPTGVMLHTDNSRLLLPVRPPRPEDADLRPFEAAEGAPPLRVKVIRPEYHNWQVIRDLAADISRLEVFSDSGCQHIDEIDLTISRKAREWYTYRKDDYDSLKGETLWERSFSRGDWSVSTVARTVLTSSRDHFFLRAELDAHEGEKRVFSENYDYTIKRELV